MWGDVKGYVLEKKVKFVKKYKGEEWEEVDSCWDYYMETDELIEEIMKEHNLKEKGDGEIMRVYYQKEHQRITNNTDSGQWLIVTDATGDRWVKCEELRFGGRRGLHHMA